MEKKFRAAGIIAEYNPFHRGHSYHINQTRTLAGADYVVVVMSGDFVQRGEPAIVDKYLRTRMALAGGADLVIELPVAWATASAEDFAQAGTAVLDSLGVIDRLSFGTESTTIGQMLRIARILAWEPEPFRILLQERIRSGMSFPAAREQALIQYLEGDPDYDADQIHKMLGKANNILGLEYMKALIRRSSPMEPLAVRRQGADYHETGLDRDYPSATGIRHFLEMGGLEEKSDPAAALQALTGLERGLAEELADRWRCSDRADWHRLMALLDYQILYSDLTGVLGLDPDLAGTIRRRHRPGMSFEELVGVLHARQRTDTALRRALLHLVLRVGDKRLDLSEKGSVFPYIRILGFRKTAGELLSAIRSRCPVPVLQKYADRKLLTEKSARYYYRMDIQSESLYEQIAARACGRRPVHVGNRQQIIF